MSRDCTLFQDEDGTAYFLSAARDNADMHVYRLSDDYLNVDCLVDKLWQGEYREAPAVIKGKYHYYMITSFCTGWAPNQGKYAVADSIEGRWSALKEIGDRTTYDSQAAFLVNYRHLDRLSLLIGLEVEASGRNLLFSCLRGVKFI